MLATCITTATSMSAGSSAVFFIRKLGRRKRGTHSSRRRTTIPNGMVHRKNYGAYFEVCFLLILREILQYALPATTTIYSIFRMLQLSMLVSNLKDAAILQGLVHIPSFTFQPREYSHPAGTRPHPSVTLRPREYSHPAGTPTHPSVAF